MARHDVVCGMRAIQITEFGGPEVLAPREIDEPSAPEGFIVVDVLAAGVNWADTHQVENSYLAPAELPLVPGGEVVGVTAEDKRVVALINRGGYAERAVVHPSLMWEVPDGIGDGEALALVLQGTTAWHLLRTSAQLRDGESVVVHAAAGGVGTIAVQLAKRFGAGRVIATASSEDKRALARELGADAAVDAREPELAAALREANGGAKVDVVLEMAGGHVFDQSLRALAPFGRLVVYGIASREGNEVASGALMARSQAVVGFWLMHCFGRAGMVAEPLEDLFGLVAAGDLRVVEGEVYGLSEARRAHEEMQARRTSGKLLLDPSR
jgi:NADPH:quinone reductase